MFFLMYLHERLLQHRYSLDSSISFFPSVNFTNLAILLECSLCTGIISRFENETNSRVVNYKVLGELLRFLLLELNRYPV